MAAIELEIPFCEKCPQCYRRWQATYVCTEDEQGWVIVSTTVVACGDDLDDVALGQWIEVSDPCKRIGWFPVFRNCCRNPKSGNSGTPPCSYWAVVMTDEESEPDPPFGIPEGCCPSSSSYVTSSSYEPTSSSTPPTSSSSPTSSSGSAPAPSSSDDSGGGGTSYPPSSVPSSEVPTSSSTPPGSSTPPSASPSPSSTPSSSDSCVDCDPCEFCGTTKSYTRTTVIEQASVFTTPDNCGPCPATTLTVTGTLTHDGGCSFSGTCTTELDRPAGAPGCAPAANNTDTKSVTVTYNPLNGLWSTNDFVPEDPLSGNCGGFTYTETSGSPCETTTTITLS